MGRRVCDTSSRPFKHTCPQPVTGLVSRLEFTGSIPVLPAVNNSRSEKLRAFYSTRKKLQVGLIQVNDDEERNGGQAGRVYGCQL